LLISKSSSEFATGFGYKISQQLRVFVASQT